MRIAQYSADFYLVYNYRTVIATYIRHALAHIGVNLK